MSCIGVSKKWIATHRKREPAPTALLANAWISTHAFYKLNEDYETLGHVLNTKKKQQQHCTKQNKSNAHHCFAHFVRTVVGEEVAPASLSPSCFQLLSFVS
jgi:uncharacterized protein YozE (UPF0346 family)